MNCFRKSLTLLVFTSTVLFIFAQSSIGRGAPDLVIAEAIVGAEGKGIIPELTVVWSVGSE